MSTIPKTRIRIQADLFTFTPFNDVLRQDISYFVPKFRAGDDVQFELGFFNNGSLQDVSTISSVILEIKPVDKTLEDRFETDSDTDDHDLRAPDVSLTPIRQKVIAAEALNTTLTQTQWDSNEAVNSHAILALSSAETNIAVGDRWLTIGIVTTDNPGLTRTVCAGPIRVLGGGLSQGSSELPDTIDEDYYNTSESDARYAQRGQNLGDLSDPSTARSNLGLGSAATADTIDEDNLASDDATKIPSQQSVKAYVDANTFPLLDEDDMASSSPTAAASQQSIVAYIDEYAGLTVLDEDDFASNSATAAPTQQSAKAYIDAEAHLIKRSRQLRNGMTFDGSSGYAVVPTTLRDFWTTDSDWHIRLLASMDDGRPAANQSLFGLLNGVNRIFATLQTDGRLAVSLADGTTNTMQTTTNPVFADGAVAFALVDLLYTTSDQNLAVYLNGSFVDNLDFSGLDMSLASFGARDFLLGARTNNSSIVEHFAGTIHHFQAFSTAAAAQVRDDFLVLTSSTLLADYRLDEGVGYQVRDHSGNRYDGLASTTGTSWREAKLQGSVRDFGLDISSSDQQLVASGRDIIPEDVLIEHLNVINRTSNSLPAGAIDIQRSDGTTELSLAANTSALGASEGAVLHPSSSQKLLARRITLPTQADPNSTNIDVEVAYRL
ncbi:MAG: hypothetical protein AAGA45_01255, partial [Verrucomicrobiota bacterium]